MVSMLIYDVRSSLVGIMTLVTHSLLPLALFRPWLRGQDRSMLGRDMAIVAFCGILPDLLSPHVYLEARFGSFSHTLWAWLVFILIVCLAGCCGKKRITPRLQVLCIAAYGLHLGCDMISGGITLFHPFSSQVYGRHLIPYLMWYVSDVILFLYAWLDWRVLPRLRSKHG